MEELRTTEEVVEKLGGIPAIAKLTSRKYNAAAHWVKFKTFPANTFIVIQDALRKKNCTAPTSLWGMVASDSEAAQ